MVSTAEESALAVEQITKQTIQTLRENCPFLKTAALERIVKKLTTTAQAELVSEEANIDKSKARISFMSLPPEIRNDIYAMVLERYIDRPAQIYDAGRGWRFTIPSLCKVSQEIRAESMSLFLSTQHFFFMIRQIGQSMDLEHVKSWLSMLDRSMTSHIKHVVLDIREFPAWGISLGYEPTKAEILAELNWQSYGMSEDVMTFYYKPSQRI